VSCLQANGRDVCEIFRLLSSLLQSCRCYIPAAIEANVIPHTVRLLRSLCRGSLLDSPSANRAALSRALKCLLLFRVYDMRTPTESWKPAIDVQIVSALGDVLALGDDPTTVRVLGPLGRVLLEDKQANAVRWAPGLARAIAQLLTAHGHPPVALCEAATILYDVARTRPQLTVDWHTWGIGASVQRLSVDEDPAVAAAADQLGKLLFCGNQDAEVSQVPCPLTCTCTCPLPPLYMSVIPAVVSVMLV
jgi:hypothetical protein